MIPGVGVRGGGGLQLLAVRGNTTARSVAFFLYFFLPCFFPFLLPSSSVSVNQVRQKKAKKKNVHLFCKETTTALFSNFGRKVLTTTEAGLAGSEEKCVEQRGEVGGHTRGLATDISWKLLDDVSAHQRTATAIVGLFGK
ncbi:hypothetical protein CHARACLAT_011870 [Characodon lateralis]|uniref:Uncharacterized protein n=1 Tax=Characodon lateralis TaxID=208331 RepID=A0ABU7ESW4_9TELE|nr:hypothetical protein [Characodon lateralis]